jgi:hypothetical protein
MSSDEATHTSSGSESGGEDQEDGRVKRAARRLRREKKKEELQHILYNPEALFSRLTRSQTEKPEVMETDGGGAGNSGKPDPAGEEEGAGEQSLPPPPSPPPPPPMPPTPLQKPPTLVPANMNVNKVVLNHVKATLPANQNGAGSGSVGSVSNPSGDTSIFTANPSGVGKLHGQSNAVNGAYKAVATLRQSSRANRSLGVGEYPGGGMVIEKISIGSFANKDDNRTELCHFRTRPERKQNSSFSFDPKSLLCSNCPSRGGHRIDGGGEERQTFILSDQNFPGVLPCSSGECLKIVRVENGSLNEIVTCFLEVTRGEGLPTGSAILLFSASHL